MARESTWNQQHPPLATLQDRAEEQAEATQEDPSPPSTDLEYYVLVRQNSADKDVETAQA
jgi:hypothetical protein